MTNATATKGNYRLPEYKIWVEMKQRCCNPNHKRYVYYGGRGIKVCERWLTSFENFIADVGPRPSPKLTLDREDNDGDYEPGNVRWVTWQVQNTNQRQHKHEWCGKGLHRMDETRVRRSGSWVCVECHRAYKREAERRRRTPVGVAQRRDPR